MNRSITESERVQNKKLNPPSIPFNSSTSSSYADSEGKYDVFLSFRGADTRHGFTDHLYNDLIEAGIYTFRDSEKLRIGEEIGHDLLRAIEDSKIWIPIFSKNYADSKWCLIEFEHIVKCKLANEGRKIYPVFYDVDVNDVKNQQRSYEEAFREHESNFDEKTVQEWRKALNTVGKFKGYELKTETNGHEGLLVKKLVKDVLSQLKKNHAYVREDHLVGMDRHVQVMTRLLHIDFHGLRIVGIHGMGGIGKTTIAKVVYNKLCDSFDGSSFLEDVREKAKQHDNGLIDLQKQLLCQVVKKDFPDIVNVDDGINKIKTIVHRKKVLVVLDDVDEKFQFDKLVGECDWLNKASRIIVTTRNKEVLNALEATCSRKGLHEAFKSYEPELMTFSDSIKLFSKHAFMRESPPEDYLSLSKNITYIAARLPLVLVTLGSLFLGIEGKALWIAKLKKLETVPNKDVMGKLKISFDALDDDDKKMFLDIACLFVGKDKRKPYYMWEDCEFVPEDGINTLVRRSLIKIRDDNKFEMHDQLRDLGRQIVREENMYKLSRMWHAKEALNVLDGGLAAKKLKDLNLSGCLGLIKCPNLSNFKDLESLVLDSCESLLEVSGLDQLESLKNLNMKGCKSIKRLPDLSKLRMLEKLILEKCKMLHSVDGLQGLLSLEHLVMTHCESIERLTGLSNLTMLKTLHVDYCGKLCEIEGLGGLESLEYLNMNFCRSIVTLPNLSNLRMLKTLLLVSCQKLVEVDLGGLVYLEKLNLFDCISIDRLLNLSHLGKLEGFSLNSCEKLHEIEGLSGLILLEFLSLSFCFALNNSLDFSCLKNLKRLELRNLEHWTEIKGLEELKSLRELDVSNCSSLEKLPDLRNFPMLKTILAKGCPNLPDWGFN